VRGYPGEILAKKVKNRTLRKRREGTRHPNRPPVGHPDEEIVDRVEAGLRNARTKDKRLGRPRKILDTKRVAARRAQGVGWKRIAAEMGARSRNYLSGHPGGFQNSGKGFWNRGRFVNWPIGSVATRSELLPKAWVHV